MFTATDSSVGGTNISSNDREVVDLTGWGTFRSSEVVIGLIKSDFLTARSIADSKIVVHILSRC